MTTEELYANINGSYESAKRILQIDKLIEKFILRFLDDKSFAQLMEAHAAGDGEGMFKAAHAMKGVCANLGLNALSEAASVVAEECRPGGRGRTLSDEELRTHMEGLASSYESTVAAIRSYFEAKA